MWDLKGSLFQSLKRCFNAHSSEKGKKPLWRQALHCAGAKTYLYMLETNQRTKCLFLLWFSFRTNKKNPKVSRTLQFVGAQKSRCYCWEPSQTEGKLGIWATFFGMFIPSRWICRASNKIVPEADSLFQPQKVDDLNSSVFSGPWGIAERFFSLWKKHWAFEQNC